jgi:glycosyltransferase involved in cell wall biosynthesis
LYSLAVAADRGDKLLYEAHAAPRHPVQRYSERQLFKHPKFARLVTISRVLADDYHALFPGLAANKTLVAHDGADEPERTASTVAMDTRRLRVGYVGQLYAGKGMEVISRMPVLLPELDFHVTGGSEADISEWKARLSAPNIHFHGFVPHAAVGEHIDRSDIVLAPYQEHVSVYGRSASVARWMSPLKLFEYMARGRAIVCSDLPVLREVLTHDGRRQFAGSLLIASCEPVSVAGRDKDLSRTLRGVPAQCACWKVSREAVAAVYARRRVPRWA